MNTPWITDRTVYAENQGDWDVLNERNQTPNCCSKSAAAELCTLLNTSWKQRISKLCCNKQMVTGNSPLHMWGWYSSTLLLHFLFKKQRWDKIWRLSSSKRKRKFCAVQKRLQISVYLTGSNPYYSLSWQNPKGSYIWWITASKSTSL